MVRKYKRVERNIKPVGRVPREIAEDIAYEILRRLSPFCDKIAIGGSIRRKEETVKDVEIVCIPKKVLKPDLFGESEEVIRHPGFVEALNGYKREKGCREKGKHIKVIHTSGIPIDIFVADKDNYGLVLFHRTGPSDVSKFIIGNWMKKKGFESRDNQLFNVNLKSPVSVPEEMDFFNAIKLSYRHPAVRALGPKQYEYYGEEGKML